MPSARRPTILQVVPAMQTGGVEQTTLDVSKAAVEGGYRVIVASSGGRMVPLLKEAGAEHVNLPLASKNPLQIMFNVRRLLRLIKRDHIGLVHARSRAPAWSAWQAARIARRPFVTTYHGIYRQNDPFKAFYNSVMARGEDVIANSHFTADLIIKRHPFAAPRILVIHRGTDMKLFDPSRLEPVGIHAMRASWGVPDQARVLIQVARLTEWKGHGVTLEAFAKLLPHFSDLYLVLAGDDQGRLLYRQSLAMQARKLGVERRVIFAGHVTDVPTAMASADAAIVASTRPEAFGRAAVEAQAMGLPVVVSDHGAVAETVIADPNDQAYNDDRTGWRVRVGDAEEAAKALQIALSLDNEARMALAKRARDHAVTHFSVEQMTQKTQTLYAKRLVA